MYSTYKETVGIGTILSRLTDRSKSQESLESIVFKYKGHLYFSSRRSIQVKEMTVNVSVAVVDSSHITIGDYFTLHRKLSPNIQRRCTDSL